MQALLGDVEGIIAVLMENSGYLLTLKFSRDFEREADDRGFQILNDARINPSGMITFFEKLAQHEKELMQSEKTSDKKPDSSADEKSDDSSESKSEKKNESMNSWFESLSTHPDTENRIEELKSKLKNTKKENYKKINLDYIRFKNYVEASS